MTRSPTGFLLAAAFLAVPASGPGAQSSTPLDFIEVDVVVVDRSGRSIHSLRQEDFTVKDSGKAVAVETFREVSGPNEDDPDSARTVVLLLDDTGIPATGTQAIQTIARALVTRASRIDEVPVVRLHKKSDEPFGDRISDDARIRDYRGGAWPFASWSSTLDVLDRIAEISRLVSSNTAKRKIIVCIGSPLICDIQEPSYSAPRTFERAWMDAVSEAALANVAVYSLIPGSAPLRGQGVADSTGGAVLASTYNMGPPIDRILQDASNYYVLGYWPVATSGAPHRVEVKVRDVKGARVHARKVR
jgi:VWFA-related protein